MTREDLIDAAVRGAFEEIYGPVLAREALTNTVSGRPEHALNGWECSVILEHWHNLHAGIRMLRRAAEIGLL